MATFDDTIGFDATTGFDDGSGGGGPGTPTIRFPSVELWWSPQTGPLEIPIWEPFPDRGTHGRMRASDGVTISRGRSDELSTFDAGTMSWTVDNRDRAFDPLNDASPYFAVLRPNIPVQLRATWETVEYVLFTGLIDGWPQAQDISQNDLVCPLTATDVTKVLAFRGLRPEWPLVCDELDGGSSSLDNVYAPPFSGGPARLDQGNRLADPKPAFAVQPSGARIAQVCDVVGVRSELRDIDGGDTALLAGIPEDDTVLDLFDRIVRTEAGKLFVSKDGKLTFRARQHSNNTAALALFADIHGWSLPYRDLVLDPLDMSLVRNEVSRGTDSDTVALRRNAASVRLHGPMSDDQDDLLFADPDELGIAATWVLDLYGSPRPRIKELVLVPARSPDALWPVVLATELGDRYALTAQPMDSGSTFAQTFDVERIEHKIAPGQWEVTWAAMRADTRTFFTLDSGALSMLDGTSVLGY